MPFLQAGQSATVTTTAANQYLRVGAFRGATAQVLVPQGLPGGPIITLTDNHAVYGPYPAGTALQVVAVAGDIEYINGTNATPCTDGPLTNTTLSAALYSLSLPAAGGNSAGLRMSLTGNDTSGSPGNAAISGFRGRAAIAAGASSCTITNAALSVTSAVFVQQRGIDATLTNLVAAAGAGNFTVTGNAAATVAVQFDFFCVTN